MLSEALVKCLIGPVGAGKSAAAQFELFRRMCQQEPDAKGVRPSRFAIVRNTAQQLRETVLPDAMQYFGDYFTHYASRNAMEFRFDLGDGTRVQSDWLLLPLERPEDQRKLLSLNLTGAFIEECREVPYEIVTALQSRVGRYPARAIVAPTWQGLILVSNPWSVSSDYHTHFVINKPESWDFFHQPGGMDPEAENKQYLPPGYYQRLLEGNSDEWIKVHVHSEFGDDQFGQAVYKAVYKPQEHVRPQLEYNYLHPIVVGMDFGRTPSAVITQVDSHGRLLVLEELTSEDMGLHKFLDTLLIPALQDRYSRGTVFVMADPAGKAKGQYNEDSAFSVLKRAGLEALPAPTNDPMRRIQAVEKWLLEMRGETRAMLIDRGACPKLVEGFERGYRYKKRKDGTLTPVPDKNDFSHIHDAMQYAALAHQGNFIGKRVMLQSRRKRTVVPPVPAKAWT